MNQNKNILAMKDVTKRFGDLTAVNSVSLEVGKGEIKGLIGPNGAGKTTLFNLINGVHEPDSGRIIFKGRNIKGMKPFEIARLGIGRSFQLIRAFEHLTVWEDLITFSRVKEPESRASELLSLCELDHLSGEYCSDLSYGQQKLLSICRSVMLDADLLLLDEPVAGVNPTMENKIVELIKNINSEGKSFIMIEHEFEKMEICDKIIALLSGEKLREADYEEIRSDEEIINRYFGG